MEYDYVRDSETPTTLVAEYYNVTDDALCTRFYEVESDEITNLGIYPRMPNDIPDPHSISEFRDGDRISLTGYTYHWRETNIITGSIRVRKINRIDVISWKKGDGFSFLSQKPRASNTRFKSENYIGCRE